MIYDKINKTDLPSIIFVCIIWLSSVVISTDCCIRQYYIGDGNNNNKSGITGGNKSNYRRPEKPLESESINMSITCLPAYNLNYCLNGGRCFNYTIPTTTGVPYCECACGFFGERCEYKLVFTECETYSINTACICYSLSVGLACSLIITYTVCYFRRNNNAS